MSDDIYDYGYDRITTAETVGLIRMIGLENLPDEKVELNGIMVNAKTTATFITLEGGLISTDMAQALKQWAINFI